MSFAAIEAVQPFLSGADHLKRLNAWLPRVDPGARASVATKQRSWQEL